MREKFKYLGKNTIIFAVSSFGTKFLSFLLLPIYTNILTTEEYGTVDIITTTATLMMYIFTINIADAVLRFAIERKTKQSEVLNYGVKVICIGSLGLIAVLILLWWSNLLGWKSEYYFFAFGYFLSTAIYQLFGNYMRAVDKVTDVAVGGIVASFVMIFSNIVFLLIVKIGITGYLICLIAGSLAGTIYLFVRARVPLKQYVNKGCDIITRREMRAYCIPLIFNNIALWINAFLDRYFVTAICGVNQNGIYSVASKIPTILAMVYTVFSQAWSLSAIKEFEKKDSDGFFSNTYEYLNAIVVLGCSGLILINIPLARLLYAKEFFVAWNYSSVLLVSVMFNSLTAYIGGIFAAVKQSKIIAYTTLISATVNMILNIILIPQLGVLGAAIATLVCYAVMWLVRLLAVRKFIDLRVNWIKDIIAYILLCIQMAFEHTGAHCYAGQIVIMLLLAALYSKNIKSILSVVKNMLTNK